MQMNPSTSMAAVPGTDFSGLANLMAMKGRGGDNTLVHMSKSELPYLNMLAKSAGYPQGLPVNPETGLPEANILKTVLPVAGAILGGMFFPPSLLGLKAGALATGIGAGLGSFGGSLLAGKSLKDAAIGGLISGGLAGVGSAVFGGGDALSANPATTGEAAQNVVNTQVQAANVAAIPSSGPPIGTNIAAFQPNVGPAPVGFAGSTLNPAALTEAYAAPVNVANLLEPKQALATQLFPKGTTEITREAATQLGRLPAEAGFTDLSALTNVPAGVDKLAYLKYAAKPATTAGLAGVALDAATEQGAFEPIDYSSFPQAGEERSIAPLSTGVRFASRRTGAFPRTEEEALAFAQPGGTRQRFFDQSFFTPAKTGGGLARLVR